MPPATDWRTTLIAHAALETGLLAAYGTPSTPEGAALVDPPAPDHDPAGALHLEARAVRSHLRLAEALVTGAPADDVSGGDRATRERFMRAMRAIAAPRTDESAVALGPPRGHGRLLDVGGAPGTYARRFAAAGWDVTVLDPPETLEVAAPGLAVAGIASVGGGWMAAAGCPLERVVSIADGWHHLLLGRRARG